MRKIVCLLLFAAIVQSSLAESAAAVEDLAIDLRAITGRLEKLEREVVELRQNQEKSSQAGHVSSETFNEKISAEQVVKVAQNRIEENDLEGARRLLLLYMERHPNDLFVGMMLFLVGDTYFREKDYTKAALNFMEGYKKNPSGSRAAETLYRLALCFHYLEKDDKAKETLDKIRRDYQEKPEWVQKAAAMRQKLG
ncbi:MAG: tetratricopeptide repeat protein [Holosporaceae bacterium]|jgi:TolA-binding protein|nr:tetratricopeptide repeat protein [Holosporaceae bacterium]